MEFFPVGSHRGGNGAAGELGLLVPHIVNAAYILVFAATTALYAHVAVVKLPVTGGESGFPSTSFEGATGYGDRIPVENAQTVLFFTGCCGTIYYEFSATCESANASIDHPHTPLCRDGVFANELNL